MASEDSADKMQADLDELEEVMAKKRAALKRKRLEEDKHIKALTAAKKRAAKHDKHVKDAEDSLKVATIMRDQDRDPTLTKHCATSKTHRDYVLKHSREPPYEHAQPSLQKLYAARKAKAAELAEGASDEDTDSDSDP